MIIHQITLPTGIQLPQCTTCRGHLFCRDLRLKHHLHVNNGERLELTTPSMSTEVIGQGIRTCDINCARCLSMAAEKGRA